jgi:hypothetical protein
MCRSSHVVSARGRGESMVVFINMVTLLDDHPADVLDQVWSQARVTHAFGEDLPRLP